MYERVGMRMQAGLRDGKLVLRLEPTGELAELMPPFEMELVPLTETTLLGWSPFSLQWRPIVFFTQPDGHTYLHDGARATPKVA